MTSRGFPRPELATAAGIGRHRPWRGSSNGLAHTRTQDRPANAQPLPLLLALTVAGCAGQPLFDNHRDAPPRGDQGPLGDAGAGDEPCGPAGLRFGRSEGEVTSGIESLLAQVRAQGAPSAYLRERIQGTQFDAVITSIRAPLAAGADEDPRPAVLNWLAGSGTGAVRAAEYRVNPQRRQEPRAVALNDVLLTGYLRVAVDGLPFPGSTHGAEGLQVLVTRLAQGWQLLQVTVTPHVVFATRGDAAVMARCTPPAPPSSAAIRGTPIQGLELSGCAPVGEYTYRANDRDRIDWDGEVRWDLSPPSPRGGPDERATWLPWRAGTLTIDPANYWPTVRRADCACHRSVGFRFRGHGITGALLRVWPGIECVVC